MSSRILFESECVIFYINQPKCHLGRDSKETGRIRWKNENPFFENFSRVKGLILSLGEGEESQGFPEV